MDSTSDAEGVDEATTWTVALDIELCAPLFSAATRMATPFPTPPSEEDIVGFEAIVTGEEPESSNPAIEEDPRGDDIVAFLLLDR